MLRSIGCAVIMYALSVVCSIAVSKRSSNWRIRPLALTACLLPLCQAGALLGRHQIWISPQVADNYSKWMKHSCPLFPINRVLKVQKLIDRLLEIGLVVSAGLAISPVW